jgi:soluble lytic murein transglycosylase-like protein
MLDSVNNITNRISEIRNIGKNFKNYKPEFVQDFDDMYKEKVLKNTSKKTEGSQLKTTTTVNQNYSLQNTNNSGINAEQRKQIDDAVKISAKKYNVSEDLVKAIIAAESNFDQFAVSKAGAMGLMQLMPRTLLNFGVEKPFDINQNIEGGVHYFRQLLDRYSGNVDKALAAYNAGPDSVDNADGVPDIKETKDYVKSIRKKLIG